MRDEMDARIWAAHHNDFSESLEAGARTLAGRLGRIELGRGPAAHLLAALLATSLTLATLGFTAG